jgi:hypothetical protein
MAEKKTGYEEHILTDVGFAQHLGSLPVQPDEGC